MTTLRTNQIKPLLLPYAFAILLCVAGAGCQKESEAIVSIARIHHT